MFEETLFITGTDTGIGKTYVTAHLAQQMAQNRKVAVFKPIQTGCLRAEDGTFLSPDLEFIKKICPAITVKYSYCFELPAAPELAASKEGVEISFEKIKEDYLALCREYEMVFVEGAGGLFVPIQQGKTMADLISFLNIPALLVSVNKLGTVNHTCLSSYYAKAKGVNLIGFLFSTISPETDPETCSEVADSNAHFISEYAEIPFLGTLPWMPLDN